MKSKCLVAVLTASALLLTSGCSVLKGGAATAAGDERSLHDLGGGARLVVPPGALPAGVTVEGRIGTAPQRLDLPGVPAVAAVEVRSSAQPAAPVSVEIPVAPSTYADLPPIVDNHVLVLHRHEQQPWAPLVGQLDRQRSVVTITTDQLSWFEVRLPDASALAEQVGRVVNGFLGEVEFSTQPPTCEREKEARDEGWQITSTDSNTLRWCLGANEEGSAQLQMVNNRRYALRAEIGQGLTVVEFSPGQLPVKLVQELNEAMGGRLTTLSPGGTTLAEATGVGPGQSTGIKTSFDGLAQSLLSLQIAAELLAEIANKVKFPGQRSKSANEALAAINGSTCVPKLLDLANNPDDDARVGAMVSGCLNSAFDGAWAVLGGIAAVTGSSIGFFWASGTALADQFTGGSDYTIRIGRTATLPAPSGTFVTPGGGFLRLEPNGTGEVSSPMACGADGSATCEDEVLFRYTRSRDGTALNGVVTGSSVWNPSGGVDLALMGDFYPLMTIGDRFVLTIRSTDELEAAGIPTSRSSTPALNRTWLSYGGGS